VTDVSDREQTERLAEEALERFGRIDALVNNAAYYTAIVKRPFEEIDDDEPNGQRSGRYYQPA